MAKGNRKNRKKPRYSRDDVSTVGGKTPKAIKHLFYPEGGDPRRPVFSFALMDHATQSAWGWHLLDEPTGKRMVEFFGEISRSTWNEIRSMTGPGKHRQHRMHHDQDISSLCAEAQQVLAGPRYEELGGEVFRFRLSGEERLWGFEIDGMFYAVWWDPNHQVYPLEPD